MTEVERILKSGRISEEFLKPEYRCDYYVNERMKKIWAVELDLYLEFERVCKKHGLKYYIFGGSLLGAVRHKGFIPWDDDIDVAMLRDDYDRFVSLAYEFENPYFLQIPLTDEYSGFSFARLRNSNTTSLIEKFKYSKMNQGICLDIFPVDKVNQDTQEKDYNAIIQLAIQNSTYMRKDNPNLSRQDIERVQKWQGMSSVEVYNKIQKIASKYNYIDENKTALMVYNAYGYERQTYDTNAFDKVVMGKFENYDVPMPIGYDNILTVAYGDYMSMPPIEMRKTVHMGAVFDPDTSYQNYISEL